MKSSEAPAESSRSVHSLRLEQVEAVDGVQAAAWGRRECPPVQEVGPGIFAIPVPVRGPIRFVYSYLIVRGDASVLIDPGDGEPAGIEALLAAFRELEFGVESLAGIVVTHFHYDHWEGADRLAALAGAWIGLSEAEWSWITSLDAEETSAGGMLSWYTEMGVPVESARQLAATVDYGDTRAYRAPDRLFRDGERLPIPGEKFEIVMTPGHTPGHFSVYDRQNHLLFSGDHVLPRITPHLAYNRFGHEDPIGQYLASLQVLRRLGEPVVLPAHEYRFRGLAARLGELEADVEERRLEVQRSRQSDQQATVWDVARHLTWSREWETFSPHHQRMALDETAAHVAHLRLAERDGSAGAAHEEA